MSIFLNANNQIRRLARPLAHTLRDRKRLATIDKEIGKLLPKLKEYHFVEKDISIDLGANRGDFSVWLLERGCFVIGLEPHPEAFQYFAKRVGSNKNILKIQAAISNKTSLGKVFVHPDARQDQLGFSIRASIKQEKPGFIPYSKTLSIDIHQLFQAIERVTVLKVDIEGSELEIWEEIKKNATKIKFLLMEVHDVINPNLRKEIESFILHKRLESHWTVNWI